MERFNPCALVPTYDNPRTLRLVVEDIRAWLPEVLVVDDGSGPEGREAAESLGRDGLAKVRRLAQNGGKGAAVKAGLAFAKELGFTHALQLDADRQHDAADIPRFLEAARAQPEALVTGEPQFDASAPGLRRKARLITRFWTDLETGGRVINDPMCGFRVYPVERSLAAARACGDRMDFDPEIAVRLVWGGAPVANLPTRVRYLTAEEGGVSHFQVFRDNVRISWMHSRLCCLGMWRWFVRPFRRLAA